MRDRFVIQAGTLSERADLYSPSNVPDDLGGSDTQYTLIEADVAIGIIPLTSYERMTNAATRNESTHRVTMRYRSDIKTNWQFRQTGGVIYHINGIVDQDLRNRKLVVTATQKEDVL